MSTTQAVPSTRKITVTVPSELLDRLSGQVAARKRSDFIVAAIEEQLDLTEQLAVIEEAAGAWTEKSHPELRTPADIDRWLAELRSSWSPLEPSNGQTLA